jgi:DNA-3-methyladenine glycosylase I
VATYDQNKVQALLQDVSIIRHRAKINAAINNAQCFIDIQNEFSSFSAYMWQFVNNKSIVNSWNTDGNSPATSPESDAWCKNLKQRGFKFVGPTICIHICRHMVITIAI